LGNRPGRLPYPTSPGTLDCQSDCDLCGSKGSLALDRLMSDLLRALRGLRANGWVITELETRASLPAEIRARYGWLPDDALRLVESIESAVRKDEKTWMQTERDFAGTSESAFSWNEWEKQSLDATDDATEAAKIVAFWSDHFPLFMSVRDGYAYLAVEKGTLRVVEGDEPEFEEARVVAHTVLEMLERMARPGPSGSRWT
jgi:hypothetical protein